MEQIPTIIFAVYLLACGTILPCYMVRQLRVRKKIKAEYRKLSEARETLEKEYTKLNEEKGQVAKNMQSVNEWMHKLKSAQVTVDKNTKEIAEKKKSSEQELESIYLDIQRLVDLKDELTQTIERLTSERQHLEESEQERLNTIAQASAAHHDKQRALENEWRIQIDANNLPENITLKEENRRKFFLYLTPYERDTEYSATYTSEPFGNARDAKAFAESLESLLGILCTIRQSEHRGEYIVWCENVADDIIKPYYSRRRDTYEFQNPAYDSTLDNREIISDEAKVLEAFYISEGMYSTGVEYEEYVSERLAASGFSNIQSTPTSGDYGADIICEKDGLKYCVQCKKYSNSVGVAAVQEICAAKAHYKCDYAVVITNNAFTAQAKQLAGDNSVILVEKFI